MAYRKDIVAELLGELVEKKLYFGKAVEHYKSRGFSLRREESLRFVEELTERDIFRWLHLIGYILQEMASSDSRFLDVLSKVMEKTKKDMAQGIIIQHLVQIGMNQPRLAIEIYDRLRKMKQ